MVKIEKHYVFDGPSGKRTLNGLFDGRRLSVFFRLDDDLFHTYSAYARGTEALTDAYALPDTTPYGRQQSLEDSPADWPQKPTYG